MTYTLRVEDTSQLDNTLTIDYLVQGFNTIHDVQAYCVEFFEVPINEWLPHNSSLLANEYNNTFFTILDSVTIKEFSHLKDLVTYDSVNHKQIEKV